MVPFLSLMSWLAWASSWMYEGTRQEHFLLSVLFSVRSHSLGFIVQRFICFESARLLSTEVQGPRLYQSCLLHLCVSLLHLLNGVFPLVDELLCLQLGLLQIFCSCIQSNLFGKQKKKCILVDSDSLWLKDFQPYEQ